MNNGDVVKCKKDFLSRITGNKIFKEDEYYIVDNFNEKYRTLSISRKDGDFKTYFDLEDSSYKKFYHHLFNDYFYTKEEVRKLKIDYILNNITE